MDARPGWAGLGRCSDQDHQRHAPGLGCTGRAEITPFVSDPSARSQVVTTLDVDEAIDATAITSVLRAHGVVDIEPYRKLGRNQLRIATFPAVGEDDVASLIAVLDHVLDTTSDA